jgi:hypothetical protein
MACNANTNEMQEFSIWYESSISFFNVMLASVLPALCGHTSIGISSDSLADVISASAVSPSKIQLMIQDVANAHQVDVAVMQDVCINGGSILFAASMIFGNALRLSASFSGHVSMEALLHAVDCIMFKFNLHCGYADVYGNSLHVNSNPIEANNMIDIDGAALAFTDTSHNVSFDMTAHCSFMASVVIDLYKIAMLSDYSGHTLEDMANLSLEELYYIQT